MTRQSSQRPAEFFTERTPRVVSAAKLHRSAHRRKTGCFLAEGWNAVTAALDSAEVHDIFVTESALERYSDTLDVAYERGVYVHGITPQAEALLASTVSSSGIFAVTSRVVVQLSEVLDHLPHPTLVAVGVDTNDPGNAGTLIRCADAFGADCVLFAGASVDPENAKSVRASAGSIFHIPVCRERDTEVALNALLGCGVQLLATAMDGEVQLDQAGGLLAKPTAWLFGNEAHGLSPAIASTARHIVAIPLFGRAESLNLASAASICLYSSAVTQHS